MRLHVVIIVTLAIFLSTLAFNLVTEESYTYHGVVMEPPLPAANFVLSEVKTKQPFHFEPGQGTVTLLYFGYTYCADVCPTTLSVWKKVKQGLDSQADRVRFIFITVDPERDTPAVLGQYISVFDSEFIGLTGSPEQLANVIESYGVWVEKENVADTELGYVMNHTASTLLINPQGEMRVSYPFGAPAEAMIEDIQHLLTLD